MSKLRNDGPAHVAVRKIIAGLASARDGFTALDMHPAAGDADGHLRLAVAALRRVVKPTVLLDAITEYEKTTGGKL